MGDDEDEWKEQDCYCLVAADWQATGNSIISIDKFWSPTSSTDFTLLCMALMEL
jgi:hypothetical protein